MKGQRSGARELEEGRQIDRAERLKNHSMVEDRDQEKVEDREQEEAVVCSCRLEDFE